MPKKCSFFHRAAKKEGVPISKGQEHFLICRSDKNTKNRHVRRNHSDVAIDDKNGCYEFIVALDHKEAVQLVSTIDSFWATLSKTPPKALDNSSITHKVGGNVPAVVSPEPGKLVTGRTLQTLPSTDTQATLSVNRPGSSSVVQDAHHYDDIAKKIDSLIKSMDKLSDCVKGKSVNNEFGPFLSLGTKNHQESLKFVNEWANIQNITQIVNRFPNLSFFVGNSHTQLSVLRCEACFRYLSRDPFSDQPSLNDALVTARKGIGK